MESNREMNNAAKNQHRAPGSGAKAGKSERSRGSQQSCSDSQALLGSCLSDPAALVSLDCKWYFPNQCCTHCASGRRQEPFCSFPMETTEIQAQHPQLYRRLLGEGLLTCRCCPGGNLQVGSAIPEQFPSIMSWQGESSPSQHSSSPFAGKPRLSHLRAPVPAWGSGNRASRVTDKTPPIPWPTLHPATFPFQTEIKHLLFLIKPPRQNPAPCMASTFNSWGCFPLSKQSLLHPELLG